MSVLTKYLRDLGYPGGTHLQCFFQKWFFFTSNCDYHTLWRTSVPAFLFLEGVTPINSPPLIQDEPYDKYQNLDSASFSFALYDNARLFRYRSKFGHYQNWSPIKDLLVYSDDASAQTQQKSSFISPGGTYHTLRRNHYLDTSLLPDMLHLAGWLDTSAGSSIMAFETMKNDCKNFLLIGPWTHGGTQVI